MSLSPTPRPFRALLIACLVLVGCGENLTPPGATPERDAGAVDARPFGTDADGSDGGSALTDVDAPGDVGGSSTPDRPSRRPGAIDELECVPNLDGRIDAEELGVAFELPISYRVSPAGEQRPIDVVGDDDGASRVAWDWSSDDADDELVVIAASHAADHWFADTFPGGEFVTPVDSDGRVLGVYARDASSVRLLGLASATPDPPEGQTLVTYEPPIVAYRFPIQPGQEWVSTGTVRGGTIRGLPYAGRDIYEFSVDAVGTLDLPDISFGQAHRLRTRVTLQPAVGVATSTRQVSFLFECFGEVARATSLPDESDPDFTTASEVRRIGL